MTASVSEFDVPVLSGRSALAGVAGWPVEHSLSPRLHGFWLNRYGVDGAYVPLAVAPDAFETAVRGLAAAGFRGLNVTVPHKEAAFSLCDTTDAAARRMGAVNTLVFETDGAIAGSNTDGIGFIENLRHGAPAWNAAAPAVIIGAGGAARGVAFALCDAGCADIRIVNRTTARAEALAEALSADAGVSATAFGFDTAADVFAGAGLVVNTTTQGMAGQPPLAMDLALAPADAVITDIVYTPLETPFLAQARSLGLTAVDGLGMLLHQARPGFAAWFGVEPEVNADLRAFVLAGR
jgi:shikimate dehydrogenase